MSVNQYEVGDQWLQKSCSMAFYGKLIVIVTEMQDLSVLADRSILV